MSDNKEEMRVKARHDVTQFYKYHPSKRTMSRQELPRADMTIEDQPNAVREDKIPDDDDVEDGTYMSSPRARPHGKGLASASDSGAARDEEEIVEEGYGNDGAEGDNDEEDEEVLMLRRSTPPPTFTWEL
jgi:hypothetical protein